MHAVPLDGPGSPSSRGAAETTAAHSPVQLSAGTIFRSADRASACGIPIGVIVRPSLQPSDNGQAVSLPCINRAAARCADCGAYLNQFCDPVAALDGVEWSCNFCGKKKNVSKMVDSILSPELQTAQVSVPAWRCAALCRACAVLLHGCAHCLCPAALVHLPCRARDCAPYLPAL